MPGETEPLPCAGAGLSSASCFQGLGLCCFPVLVPPGAHAVCASCQGAVLYLVFFERDVSCCPRAKAPLGGGWSRLHHIQPWPLALPGRMAPLQAAGALTQWSMLILRQAQPIGSCPLLLAVLPLQPVLPNLLFSVRSPLLLPFPPSSSSPCLPSSLSPPYS